MIVEIVAGLLPENVAVFDTDASHADLARLPYVLILGRDGVRGEEETVMGRDSADGEVTVRAVGQSRWQVESVLARVRLGLDRRRRTVGGRLVDFTVVESRGLFVDRDVTIPGGSGSPMFADDVYEIRSQEG